MTLNRYFLKILIILIIIMPTKSMALVDPTQPADEDTAFSFSNMQLSAIMIWPNRRLAVISGKIVHEGDTINRAKVVKINANTVDMEGPNGVFTIQLLPNPLKKVK